MWEDLKKQFILNFIKNGRWHYLTGGLKVTLIITFFAVIIGLLLGASSAMIRSKYEHTKKLRLLNAICNIYIAVIRGTPVTIQLLIIYFIVFGSMKVDKTLVAVIAFGINSGAYQSEIFRAGIQSISKGQFEAGRSLGFNYNQTMRYIIMPQAIKNIIPTLANEFIVLLKETSVAGYIALIDLTKAADIIRSKTYSAFMPLIAVALIYLILVLGLSYVVNIIERGLSHAGR